MSQFTGALAQRLAGRIARHVPGSIPRSAPGVLFIDGHSGSGKTTLARSLAEEYRRRGWAAPNIVGMDELYPGWQGLRAGSEAVGALIRSREYSRYDWYAERFTERVALDPGSPLIIEGCGSLSADALAAARSLGDSYAVWISSPAALRRERAIARDGETFAPHWDEWAAQEQAYFARTKPLARATEVVHVGQ